LSFIDLVLGVPNVMEHVLPAMGKIDGYHR
jgi:hypothetical protein